MDDAKNGRLDSWKEIAAHFRRSVRTVQNWERSEGLPIHRHRHKKLGSVYALREELDAWWEIHEQRVDPPRRVSTYKALIGLALLGAAGALHIEFQDSKPQPPPRAEDPSSRSLRGDAIAYHSEENGNFDIWVKSSAGGIPANLTKDYPGTDKNPIWSPDGTRLVFFSEREGGGYFTVPSTGGPARRIPGCDASALGPPAWSPDSAALAWVRASSKTPGRTEALVYVHSLEQGEMRVVPVPQDSDWRFDLRWSPDGHSLHVLQQRAGAVDLEEPR